MKTLTTILLLLTTSLVFAGGGKMPSPVKQDQHQVQGQLQGQASELTNDVSIGNASTAAVSIAHAEGAPDIVMVPQGHTANCQRTYGISFSSTGGGGGIGWPTRDKNCDYDNEAADAFASGQHSIGWYWNCHKKSSYKPFKTKGVEREEAILACHSKMMSMFVVAVPEPAPGPVEVDCSHPETHERLFKACVEK